MDQQFNECLCNHCGERLTFNLEDFIQTEQDENFFFGQTVPCRHCKKKTTYYIEKQSMARITQKKSPTGLRCVYCKSSRISPPQTKINQTGVILIVIGVVFTVVIVGLVLILIGINQKEVKYTCYNCRKMF